VINMDTFPRQVAADMILDTARDIDTLAISEWLSDHLDDEDALGLSGPDIDTLIAAIAEAIATTDITVEWSDQPAPDEEPVYLLWSGKHGMWWKPAGWGYTDDKAEAGRFTRLEAMRRVARSADSGNVEHVTRMVHQGATP
jgi:hypothetical protein